jgi:uncharacterized protein (TIGR02246 family)
VTTDEQAIQQVLTKLEAAWNANDPEVYAALFAENATFIQIYGGQLDGRRAIEASHRVILDTIYKGSEARFTVQSIRTIRPGVAVAFTRAHLSYYQGDKPLEMDTRPTFIMSKEPAGWQIVACQNTRVSEMPVAAQAASRLAT